MRNDLRVDYLVYFKSAYFLQRSFLVQHGAVDITRGGHQYPVTALCPVNEMTQSTIEPKRAYATHFRPQDNKQV